MGNKVFKLHGPCVALPTPFHDGAVDFAALERLCHRQIEHGTTALVPCGPTGEAPLLTPGEHHRIVERTVAAAAGRVPVIAGAGSNGTLASVELARSAELAGAQALLCTGPGAPSALEPCPSLIPAGLPRATLARGTPAAAGSSCSIIADLRRR